MEHNIKLGFSGGGFRATFYALGAYKRLVECNMDQLVTSISSVSGGSITAATIMLALKNGGPFQDGNDFSNRVIKPLKTLGQIDLRAQIISRAIKNLSFSLKLPRNQISEVFPEVLDDLLLHGTKMYELSNLNTSWQCATTCLDTMRLFYFSPREMYGTFLGDAPIGDISMSFAVACSAAFPALFSPITLDTKNIKFTDSHHLLEEGEKFEQSDIRLADGGVFDNLGTEPLLQTTSVTLREDIVNEANKSHYKKEPILYLPKREKEVYILLDASARDTVWGEKYNPSYRVLNKRILDTTTHQVVLLRRKILQNLNRNDFPGMQLILSKPIKHLLDEKKNPYADSIKFPDYNLPPYTGTPCTVGTACNNLEDLIAGLRTDLDGFHDIEIEMLMLAGEIRMDIALRCLFPEKYEKTE